jgi:hypothetical protein
VGEDHGVAGSSPASTIDGGLAEWFKAPVPKTGKRFWKKRAWVQILHPPFVSYVTEDWQSGECSGVLNRRGINPPEVRVLYPPPIVCG